MASANTIYNTSRSSHSYVEVTSESSIDETERQIANALISRSVKNFNDGCAKKPNIKCTPNYQIEDKNHHSHLMFNNEENEMSTMFAYGAHNTPRALPDGYIDSFSGNCGKYGPNNEKPLSRTIRRDISSNSFYDSNLIFTTENLQDEFYDIEKSRFIVKFNKNQDNFNAQKALNSRYSVKNISIDPLTISEHLVFNKDHSLYTENIIERDSETNKLIASSSKITNPLSGIKLTTGQSAYSVTINSNSKVNTNVFFGAIKLYRETPGYGGNYNPDISIYYINNFIGDPSTYPIGDWIKLGEYTLDNISKGITLPIPGTHDNVNPTPSFISIKKNTGTISGNGSLNNYFIIPRPQFVVTAVNTSHITSYPYTFSQELLTKKYIDFDFYFSSYKPFSSDTVNFNNFDIKFKNANESYYNLKYNPTYANVKQPALGAKIYNIYIPGNNINIDFYPEELNNGDIPLDYMKKAIRLYSGPITELTKYIVDSKNTNTYTYTVADPKNHTHLVKHINYISGSVDTETNLYTFSFTQPGKNTGLVTINENTYYGENKTQLMNIKINGIIPFLHIPSTEKKYIELGNCSCLQTYLYGSSFIKDISGNIMLNIVRYESDIGISNLVWPETSTDGVLKIEDDFKSVYNPSNFIYPEKVDTDFGDLDVFKLKKFGMWPIRRRYKTFTLYTPYNIDRTLKELTATPFNFMDTLNNYVKNGGISVDNWKNEWITNDTSIWSPWLVNGGSIKNIWSSYNVYVNNSNINSRVPNILRFNIKCLSTIGQSILARIFAVSKKSPFRAIVCEYDPILTLLSGDGVPIQITNAFGIQKLMKTEMKYFLLNNAIEYNVYNTFDHNFNFLLNGISL